MKSTNAMEFSKRRAENLDRLKKLSITLSQVEGKDIRQALDTLQLLESQDMRELAEKSEVHNGRYENLIHEYRRLIDATERSLYHMKNWVQMEIEKNNMEDMVMVYAPPNLLIEKGILRIIEDSV